MADFIAHHLFGQKALSVFPAPAQRMAAQHPSCFHWGCQGPDPFFYRKLLFGSPLHALGNRIHSEKTAEWFSALAAGVQCLTGAAHTIAQAYFYGFLCHYALDSEIHPYVYCRQQQICQANAKLSASAVHCQIEGDIDMALYERRYQEPVTEFDLKTPYTLNAEEKAVISSLLHAAILHVYKEDVSTVDCRKAFDEMLFWESYLYSEHRWTYRGAQKVERLLGRGALITGHMKVDLPTWAALNEHHEKWVNLWRPQELRLDSVPELMELARIRACALAGQYAAQFDAGILLHMPYPIPFDNGSPKKVRHE